MWHKCYISDVNWWDESHIIGDVNWRDLTLDIMHHGFEVGGHVHAAGGGAGGDT